LLTFLRFFLLKNWSFKINLRLLALINSNNYTMKTKFNGILTLLLALVVQISFAQEKTVSGTVTDDSGGLPGVSILIKGTTKGTDTDFDGKYSLKVNTGDVLVFSYIGYETVERKVGASNTIDVKMKEGGNILDEVVITGYTTTTRKKQATASTQISAKTVENRPSTSLVQTLTGQVPGLAISTSTGQPGANSLVQLRGVNSINGNTEPLFIMDGVPINEDNFRSLNQNEIESITVLKDAGATAIYGSRGANGVIVIKTKTGKAGSPLKVLYTGIASFSSILGNDYNLMNSQQYATLERSRGVGFGGGNNIGGNPNANPSVAVALNPFGTGTPLTDAQIAQLPTTDWLNFFMRTGFTQNHNLTLTSGGENASQFTSINYTNIEGTLKNSNLQRISIRNNINGSSDRFSYATSVSLNYSKNDAPTSIGTNGVNQNPFFGAIGSIPYLTPEMQPTADELSRNFFVAFGAFYADDKLRTSIALEEELKIVASLTGSYKITDDITASLTTGVDYESVFDYDSQIGDSRNQLRFVRNAPGSARHDSDRRVSLNTTTSLNWTKSYGKHTINAGAYLEYFRAHQRFFGFQQQGLNAKSFAPFDGAGFIPDNGNDDFFVDTVFATKLDAGLLSYFATADYDFDSRFGFFATLRRDASYRFAQTNRWGTFWSVSGRWNMDQETWMEDLPFNSLKLRASYGTTGNQRIVDGSVFTAPDLAFNFFGTGTGYQGANTIGLTQLGNDTLKWETVQQFNVGVDFAIFDSRLRGSLDYYRKKTVDLFQNQRISGVNGQFTLRANVGDINNNGVDVDLRYDLIRNDDLRLTLNVVGNYNKNFLENIPNDVGFIPGIGRNGGRIGEVFTVRYAGVNPANGNLLFLDVNGNLTETPNLDTDRVWTDRNITPDAQGSFGFDLDYKGFFLQTQFNYTLGVDLFDNDYANFTDPDDIGVLQLSADILRHWTPTNRITDIPSLDASNRALGFSSDRFLVPTDHIRLRFVTFGYNVPQKFLAKTGFTNVRLFAQGENLATWTKFRGFDAASRSTGRQYPTPRIISFGIELGL